MSCLFCQICDQQAPASVIYRDQLAMVILDLFPVHQGHALIIPHHHCERVEQLPEATSAHLFLLAQRTIKALAACGLAGDGQNILINNGPAANQHVPHVHLHVLPRQSGDVLSTLWHFSTRMLRRVGMEGRRRQLDLLAGRIAAVF